MSETLLPPVRGRDAIALLGVRAADRRPPHKLWDLRKICLDNDTRLYLMSVPTEKIAQCIEFKNVSRGSSLHLQLEAWSGRYGCLCVVESN